MNKSLDILKLISKLTVISFILLIQGCKGGNTEGSQANAESSQPSDESSKYIQTSTSLSNNPLSTRVGFSNYTNKTITLSPSSLEIIGDRLFLKLYRLSGDVLYLGEIDRYSDFELKVSLLLDDKFLNYELFTTDDRDETQQGVIIL